MISNLVLKNTAYSAYFIGIWSFAFKNWVTSREIPKILTGMAILKEEEVKKVYCIPLEKMNERSYTKLYWSVSGTIVFCEFYYYFMTMLSQTQTKLTPSILVLCITALLFQIIPTMLPFSFHLKSVISIYKTTKSIPNFTSNLTVMTMHSVMLLTGVVTGVVLLALLVFMLMLFYFNKSFDKVDVWYAFFDSLWKFFFMV